MEENMRNWWYCDNIVTNKGMIGLLYMGEPRVFILIRDYADMYFRSYEEFAEHIAEINFFNPDEREGTDLDAILTDAWNFMALQEREDERIVEESEGDLF